MKRACRVFGLMMVIVILSGLLAVPAAAADWEYTFTGTVGETAYFVITSNAYDEILEANLYNGSIPGMELNVAGGVTLGLAGVPTTAGEFTVYIMLTTKELGIIDIKVVVTIEPSSVTSGTPVVTKNPTGETVVEGESATFIARADNVRQYVWEIAIADASIDCSELESYIGKGIKVSGWDTDTLVISNIPVELDGAYVWCQFVGAEESVDSKAVEIKVIPQEDATPVVTKNPTDETVEEGGEAVFIAKAKYAQSYLWQLVSPDGKVYNCKDAPKTFSGLKVSGADTERIVLKNIPLELDGYRILCKFTAGEEVSSKSAKLNVTPKPTEPTTEPPTEETTEATTEATTEPPVETTTEAPTEAPVTTEKVTEPPEPEKEEQRESGSGGGVALIIVAIIAVTVVAVAGIAGFVILKLKGVLD